MDVVSPNFLPGDPRLIDQIVYELKSQGLFDQFRKECIADVDTKPAYQNLSQRVEGSVMNFLNKQKFAVDLNKNQLREQLRKSISDSGFLDSGVERIVDQVVNPKTSSVFLPKVEDVVYRFLGIERPNQENRQPDVKPKIENLLPNDLEAVSPESVHDQSANSSIEKKGENIEEANDNSFNSSNTKTEEDESPPFEPLEENTKFSAHEENSVDSHLSGMSGLASHDSVHSNDINVSSQMDISQDVTQNSLNSECNLSIITSEDDTKMEIGDVPVMSVMSDAIDTNIEKRNEQITEDNKKNEEKGDSNVNATEINLKNEEKNKIDIKNDSKRTHDKYRSSRSEKDKKEDKEQKRRSSKSDSKYKDKSSSKPSSSSKDKDKEKKEYTNGKDEDKDKSLKKEEKERNKNKDKSRDNKDKSEKSKERSDKSKDKEKGSKDRSNKEKSDKDKAKLDKETDKYKSSKDKSKLDKDKSSTSKHSKEKSNSLKKDGKEKDKYEDKSSKDKISKDKISSSNNKNKEKDKEFSKSLKDKSKSSSSNSKDKSDSKPRTSDKYKKSDKDKPSSRDRNNSSSRKDKEKKIIDDHYSLKDKRSDRRSTDRDSNDGSSKTSRNSSFTDTYSNSYKASSKESSEVFSSGGGDSSNSDKVEEKLVGTMDESSNGNLAITEASASFKYIKPKFASNIHEAMKLMKIRKQLAKLERQNQLALTHLPKAHGTDGESNRQNPVEVIEKESSPNSTNSFNMVKQQNMPKNTISNPLDKDKEDASILKSQDLSMETFEALEARLAQEMSNINDHLYGDEEDNYECSSVIISPTKRRKRYSKIIGQEIEKKIPEIDKSVVEPVCSQPISSMTCSENASQLQTEKRPRENDEDEENSASKRNSSNSMDVLTMEKEPCTFTKFNNSKAEEPTNVNSELTINEVVEKENTNTFTNIKGFTAAERNTSLLDNIKQKIDELSEKIAKAIKTNESIKKRTPKTTYSPIKSEMKKPKLIASIHKNGKKLLIKMDKLEAELTPKVLDTLQGMGLGEIIKKQIVSKSEVIKDIPNGAKVLQKNLCDARENGKSIKNKVNNEIEKKTKQEENDACYYFDKNDTVSDHHLAILNSYVAKLEKSIEEQSLKIQNNIPKPKKRGRKRKVHGTENNNSIGCEFKPERKRRLLSDANSIQNRDNVRNTDVSSHQNFSLPLSPADSDKSGEQKKEELITVKPKRGASTKRYSSEDLYKPRPILRCTSSRRRSGRIDDNRS